MLGFRRFRMLSPTNDGGEGGGGSGDGGNQGGSGGNNQGGNNRPAQVVFTAEQQEAINRMVGNARTEGRDKGVTELLGKLKVKTPDELVEQWKKDRQAQAGTEQTVETLNQQVQTLTEAHNAELAKARTLIVSLAVRAKATEKGLDPQKVVDVLTSVGGLATLEVNLETGAVTDLDKVIDSLAGLAPQPQEQPEGQQGGGKPRRRMPPQTQSDPKKGTENSGSLVTSYVGSAYKRPSERKPTR